MAFYKNLGSYQKFNGTDQQTGQSGKEKADWIARHLLLMRRHLIGDLADQMAEENNTGHLGRTKAKNLVIGSWNIRAFDDGDPRLDESYHYIAEIIDKFDICAVQEIKSDLAPLKRLMSLLGPDWDYLVTDVVEGGSGNNERSAFLYNRNKVRFRSVVGEMVLPHNDQISDSDGENRQIARTPFFASFQSGWFRFTLVSTHIIFGDDLAMREQELTAIASRAKKRSKAEDETYILLGDMNIPNRQSHVFATLKSHDFIAPDFGGTNIKGDKYYDQIAFSGEGKTTKLVQYGCIPWQNWLYQPEEKEQYHAMNNVQRAAYGKNPYSDWEKAYRSHFMTFEMSDHLPIWVEIETVYSDDYLEQFTI